MAPIGAAQSPDIARIIWSFPARIRPGALGQTARTNVVSATIGATALAALTLAGCASSSAPETDVNVVAERSSPPSRGTVDSLIAYYADAYNLPQSLVHASVQRESGYNPTSRRGPFWGLMQLRYDTARSMGYSGPPAGLLDAGTNLKFGVPYLANAYLVAGGDQRRALQLYASGYYYQAKRRGLLKQLRIAEY